MASHTYGLSGSGIDVDSLVKQAMKAQQTRYDSLYKKKTQLEWKKADYNEIYKAVNDFRSNTAFNYKLQSTLNPKKASTSNSDAIEVKATADAASVNHRLEVTNVAEGVNLISDSGTVGITPAGRDKTTLASQFALVTDAFSIRLTNGTESKEITIDPSKQSIYDLVNTINNAGIHIQANYDTNLDRVFLYTSNTGAKATLDFSGSSAKGFDFINNNLKIATPTDAMASGSTIVSKDSLGLKVPLGLRFANLTSSFELKIHDATKNVDQMISVNPATDSLSTLMAKINDTSAIPNAQASINYDQATGKLSITSNIGSTLELSASNSSFSTDLGLPDSVPATGATGTADLRMASATDALSKLGLKEDVTLKMKVGGIDHSITVTTGETLDTLIGQINATGAQASYDAATGKFSIKADGNTLDFSGNDSKALSFLTGTLDLPVLHANTGVDANIKLDGVAFKEDSNIFTIAGLTYTIKDKTTSPVNVSVTNDIDKIVENVNKFVDAYNKLLDKINTEVDETKYKDYLPLTTEEKGQLKDSEVSQWEQKAKSGMLRNESILKNLAYDLRNELASPVAGINSKYNSASSIGITSGGYYEKGKLYVNETALRNALEEDPNAFNNIFGAKSADQSKQGIAVKMYDMLKVASDQGVQTGGATDGTDYDTESTLAKELRDYTDRMSDMASRLKDMEDRYYKQFDAMETALSNMNKQSSWLSQQFSS